MLHPHTCFLYPSKSEWWFEVYVKWVKYSPVTFVKNIFWYVGYKPRISYNILCSILFAGSRFLRMIPVDWTNRFFKLYKWGKVKKLFCYVLTFWYNNTWVIMSDRIWQGIGILGGLGMWVNTIWVSLTFKEYPRYL